LQAELGLIQGRKQDIGHCDSASKRRGVLEEPNKAPMADGPVAFQRLPVDHERNSPVGLLQKKTGNCHRQAESIRRSDFPQRLARAFCAPWTLIRHF